VLGRSVVKMVGVFLRLKMTPTIPRKMLGTPGNPVLEVGNEISISEISSDF
jgi:hypothetical protein